LKTDIEIAQSSPMEPITEIARKLGIPGDGIDQYGPYKGKLTEKYLKELSQKTGKRGRLILVTAVNPTPAGEGKTTVSIGLADALSLLGKKAVLALREPSLGPCFGMKGGAAGGGYAQVLPMEDLNLHFTGDFHAITAADNLLAALIDNHIHQGNALGIDPARIVWKRCEDMNDRALRQIVTGLGGHANGPVREDRYVITAASEVMAVLCLSRDLPDMKARLGRIVIGYTYDNTPVTAADLHAVGAMAALLRDALRPNLVQTIGRTPALVHGGPFANIAHGCNSVRATSAALAMSDYTVTEAGFGADLGAEKFFDIKCRSAALKPDAAVLVVTVRSLKYNGGVPKSALDTEDTGAVSRGIGNLAKHLENIAKFGVPVVVALNVRTSDTPAEKEVIRSFCREKGVPCALTTVWADGGKGGIELAQEVLHTIETVPSGFHELYPLELPIREKIAAVAKEIYGADGVDYTADALKQLARAEAEGAGGLPVCIAKTQYSLTDDPKRLGRPEGFRITVREIYLSAGAGFVVATTGEIMAMPGLPKVPAACSIDVDDDGRITGLF
jgi:formate--tetrahydrofolate ligase